jgi:hypothetical protein
MIDKNLRSLERLQDQDPVRLKLLQRRLGHGVYIQEAPRPIKVFNSTELLILIKGRDGQEKDENSGVGDLEGGGLGCGLPLDENLFYSHTMVPLRKDSFDDGTGGGEGCASGVGKIGLWSHGGGASFGEGSENGGDEWS